MSSIVTAVRRERNVPEGVAARSTVHDYVDLFTAAIGDAPELAIEQWARTVIGDTAGAGGQFVWRGVLGLRLKDRPYNVAGWRIADRGQDWLRLEASSWCMTANIVIQVADGTLSMATFVGYDRPVARLIWTPASAVHRMLMPGLLSRAVKSRQPVTA